MQNIKMRLAEIAKKVKEFQQAVIKNPDLAREAVYRYHEMIPSMSVKDVFTQIQEESLGWYEIGLIAKKGKTILFPKEQAEVFLSVVDEYHAPLDYRLPFPNTIIQFSEPLAVKILDRQISETEFVTDYIKALLLTQNEVKKEEILRTKQAMDKNPFNLLVVHDEIDEGSNIMNGCYAIFTDDNHSRFSWKAGSTRELARPDPENEIGSKINEQQIILKKLAIACIGYINCENVYLHKEGVVPEAVNAKREKKGKSRLEPYYVCRIRGVQYDNQGYEKGAGTTHGFRYDVRGHFRHLPTGKTIWVRPHQRGLQNELYVPKTYVVDKRGKA